MLILQKQGFGSGADIIFNFAFVSGIYIHVPFCKQACNYCNFYFSTSAANKAKYVQALLHEIELTSGYLPDKRIHTIYIGGGTPSLLNKQELGSIMHALKQVYDLSALQEFTIEANPDDVTDANVQMWQTFKQDGLNRFSLGVQSFFDEDLQYTNRLHSAAHARLSIEKLQMAGFDLLTIDLIYGIPTLTHQHWLENLNTAIGMGIEHISAYALTVEPKTTLANKIKRKQLPPVVEEQSATQFEMLVETLKSAGYKQYEISNFARNGKYAIHNSNYWNGSAYLGLGPSAHSYNGKARRWNVANNINYIQSLATSRLPYEEEILSPAQITNEIIMTGLRTQWGLNLERIQPEHNEKVLKSLADINPLHYSLQQQVIQLTDAGKLFADNIAASLFVDDF